MRAKFRPSLESRHSRPDDNDDDNTDDDDDDNTNDDDDADDTNDDDDDQRGRATMGDGNMLDRRCECFTTVAGCGNEGPVETNKDGSFPTQSRHRPLRTAGVHAAPSRAQVLDKHKRPLLFEEQAKENTKEGANESNSETRGVNQC